jgi:uncharacterized integral membrane protein
MLSFLFIIVFFQNTHVATLNLIFWKLEMSLSILSLLSLILGAVIGYIIAKIFEHHAKKGE